MTLIERSVPFEFRDNADTGDGLTLDGYAAIWDSPTEIDSWEGTFEETIQRGAFKKSFRERTPVMQFDHGRHVLIGSIPIGLINTAEEDDRGAHVVARLSNNWLIQPVRDAIRDRTIDGMSFRFDVIRDIWTDADGNVLTDPKEIEQQLYMPSDNGPLRRTLVEVKVPELGPVVWPAYTDTTVSVRARSVAHEIEADDKMRHQLFVELRHGDSVASSDGPVGEDGLPADGDYRATDPKKPYGDVPYADPGYQKDGKKRYPLDTKEHAKAAWGFINQAKNAAKYAADKLAKVKAKIMAACKKFGVMISGSKDDAATFEELPVRDVALALLFGDTVRDAVSDDAPPGVDGHPESPQDEQRDAPPEVKAPVEEGVPDDAPLPDEHPSSQDSHIKPSEVLRDAQYRSSYLALILKGAERYDGS